MDHIRNIAIIAHVDHGKTTLVDCLLKQSGTFRANQAISSEERIMDSMDLEREKGITIRAKNAAFKYKDYHINIVDTPGHADFGGEVERIMNMIDGVLLVVDAADGPQAQTRFVLRKALEAGAKPIVVINKIDRDNANPHKVLDQVFELFVSLHATDEQLDFPFVYASAKEGYAKIDLKHAEHDDGAAVRRHHQTHSRRRAPMPAMDFKMLVANLDYSRLPRAHRVRQNLQRQGQGGRPGRLPSRRRPQNRGQNHGDFSFRGPEAHRDSRRRTPATSSAWPASRMCSSAKRSRDNVDARSRCRSCRLIRRPSRCNSPSTTARWPVRTASWSPPGISGSGLTKEIRTNVALRIAQTERPNIFNVSGRGEMQIAILVEQMRREGYEVLVSRPEVHLSQGRGRQFAGADRKAVPGNSQGSHGRRHGKPFRPQGGNHQHEPSRQRGDHRGADSHARPDRF